MALDVIIENYNAISLSPMQLRFPDGEIRWTLFMLAGWIADQQEYDKLCCEGSQTCKPCKAPKDRLHEQHTVFAPRKAKEVERAVCNAAFHGRLPGQAAGQKAGPPLFTLGTDAKSKRPRWFPTAACTPARYEEVRKALNGVHLLPNALWGAHYYDYLKQV